MRRQQKAARRIVPRSSIRGEAFAADVRAKVFAGRELRYLAVGEGGAKDVRVV